MDSGEKLHILMVDDAPSVILTMTRALRNLDVNIVTATTGQEALEKAEQHDYALVLLDMHLPDITGLEVAEELSRRETTRHLPIIFVTAANDEELLFQGYQHGAVDYLFKPVHPSILLSKASVFCRLKQQNRIISRHINQLEKEMEERRQAELRHRESEMRYRVLSELSPVAVCVHTEGQIQYVNRAMLDLLQVNSHEELIERDPQEFLAEEERQRFHDFNAEIECMNRSHETIQTVFLRSDGKRVDVEVNGACVPYKDGWGVQFAVLDITQHKQFEQQLKRTALFDGLTNIPNRRKFDETFDAEWRRAYREKQPLSVIIADVDHFKQFNDNYGHPAGDDCLRQVASVISKCARRPADLIARYGGEEFAAILPNTDAEGACKVANNMCVQIASLGIEHKFSEAANIVTASFGTASTTPSESVTPASLLHAADGALYQAKRSGRNQVALATEPVELQP